MSFWTRPSIQRSLVVGAVYAASLVLDLRERTWWSAALMSVLSVASLVFLVVSKDSVFNVLSILAGRPVAVTARARSLVQMPERTLRLRLRAAWWTFLMVALVALEVA